MVKTTRLWYKIPDKIRVPYIVTYATRSGDGKHRKQIRHPCLILVTKGFFSFSFGVVRCSHWHTLFRSSVHSFAPVLPETLPTRNPSVDFSRLPYPYYVPQDSTSLLQLGCFHTPISLSFVSLGPRPCPTIGPLLVFPGTPTWLYLLLFKSPNPTSETPGSLP